MGLTAELLFPFRKIWKQYNMKQKCIIDEIKEIFCENIGFLHFDWFQRQLPIKIEFVYTTLSLANTLWKKGFLWMEGTQ